MASSQTPLLLCSEPTFGIPSRGRELRSRRSQDTTSRVPKCLNTYSGSRLASQAGLSAGSRTAAPRHSEGAGLCWMAGYDLLSPLSIRTTKSLVFHTEADHESSASSSGTPSSYLSSVALMLSMLFLISGLDAACCSAKESSVLCETVSKLTVIIRATW